MHDYQTSPQSQIITAALEKTGFRNWPERDSNPLVLVIIQTFKALSYHKS